MSEIKRYHEGTWYTCRPAAGGVWYIFWSERRRSKRESTGEKEVAAAAVYFDEFLRLKSAPAGRKFTIRDLYELKYGMRNDRPGQAWKHLAVVFAPMTPDLVTQSIIDRYVEARRKSASASTVRYEVACLAAAINYAADKRRKLISADDVPAIDIPAGSPRRERWLKDAEIDALFEAARGHERVCLFLHIALDAAARRTAICELTWDQVDWEADDHNGIIHFLPDGEQQTRKRRASVPMSRRLRAALWDAYGKRTNQWVLGSPAKINQPLARVVARSGVNGVTPHVLRHTAATHMARRGTPLWIIAQVLGNTLEEVERTYAKYQPEFARSAVEAIGGTWGRPKLNVVEGGK